MPGTRTSLPHHLLEDYELDAWEDYPVASRNLIRFSDRDIETMVFAGVVGVVAVGLIAGFWAMRRR